MDFLQKMIPVTALILIVLFVLILIFRRLAYRRTATFKCPACGQVFRPTLMQLIFSVGSRKGQILYCPNCGEKNYLEQLENETPETTRMLLRNEQHSCFYRCIIFIQERYPMLPQSPKGAGLWINIYRIRILQGRPGGDVFQSRHHRPDTPQPSHF